MCVIPSTPKIPTPVERQAVQVPQDPVDSRTGLSAQRKRGFWSSIMTSPQGVSGPPAVTGTPGY